MYKMHDHVFDAITVELGRYSDRCCSICGHVMDLNDVRELFRRSMDIRIAKDLDALVAKDSEIIEGKARIIDHIPQLQGATIDTTGRPV